MTSVSDLLQRRAAVNHFPGGSLNFERFETESIDDCTDFICQLIDRSARINRVSIAEMRRSVKIMATGGGAYRYCDMLRTRTVYYFSDDLIRSVRAPHQFLPASPSNEPLERPSPNPPEYQVAFAAPPTASNPHLPCLVVNIGSGVSILRVDASGQFERVSGSALGGGTLWGLLSLLTGATSFDEMLALSERGDHSKVDMLVGDIYGNESGGTDKLGLKANVIASSFGKVFKKGKGAERGSFAPEDISRSLLYAISNNIGHIAYMNAEKYGLKRIYFGGCFIRGHATTIATLSYAIRFWSKGSMRAMFLRHEGFLGSIGAWIKNIDQSNTTSPSSPTAHHPRRHPTPQSRRHIAPRSLFSLKTSLSLS
ncbi:pantothenate kinase [Rhizoctonia solani]|uniref:pantothenate kinase n=1 Tax=Rhizoctonia solani TaxID=456999 RepID=A0A8H8T1P3_9AGAM|nr:pantothenate kinase [Rhizoctonia solani]QRW24703.1 pantothenate kinase [Rhizoctonia solani]